MDEEMLEELILAGAVEVAGIDSENGEFLYSFTPKLESVNPGLARKLQQAFHDDIMVLWEQGFIDIDFLKPSPMVSLTEKSFDKVARDSLNEHLKTTLTNVINSLSQ